MFPCCGSNVKKSCFTIFSFSGSISNAVQFGMRLEKEPFPQMALLLKNKRINLTLAKVEPRFQVLCKTYHSFLFFLSDLVVPFKILHLIFWNKIIIKIFIVNRTLNTFLLFMIALESRANQVRSATFPFFFQKHNFTFPSFIIFLVISNGRKETFEFAAKIFTKQNSPFFMRNK